MSHTVLHQLRAIRQAMAQSAPIFWAVMLACQSLPAAAQVGDITPVESQPLAANVARLLDALDYLGSPLPRETTQALRSAIATRDPDLLQTLLDPHVLFRISINPELRVKVQRGKADALIQQSGFTPVLIKVQNDATLTRHLRVGSPQAGPVYAGVDAVSLERQAQPQHSHNENLHRDHRFLDVELFDQPPMTPQLSGLAVEYVLALISSSEAGRREATLVFDVGEGTQDLGFRSEVPVLFTVRPAVPVRLEVRDFDGQPTTARLEFRDEHGRVFPQQAKRLAPDLFFQPQIYRADGSTVLLPPGTFTLESSRGPEYRRSTQTITVREGSDNVAHIQCDRWFNPSAFGFYSGDHHIHAAGCSHYDSPTEGVGPGDMFAQVKGEGLNVGCVLTWGPCFNYQREYFSPTINTVSEPLTVLKYDLEISGFGSAAMGHVCLLNLKDQTYPGSNGSKSEGWPTWTTPVMQWAKAQGGVVGFPHSALRVEPRRAAEWLLRQLDADRSKTLNPAETAGRLLPEAFAQIDRDQDRLLSLEELEASQDRAADRLPNLGLPAMNGGGAMEIFVSIAEGACDFISAMDTARIPEWNTWYHLLNCGFPLKLSGETDFPCMSGIRVGQGRVYVQLGDIARVDFAKWCDGLAAGRSYVSDGYAHAPQFTVQGVSPGTGTVRLTGAASVRVVAQVAFAPEQPRATAYGTLLPPSGPRKVGDTINLHAPRDSGNVQGGERLVEVVLNGQVVASTTVPADGAVHSVSFDVPVKQSSWIALRQFPQLHTNPVDIVMDDQPIRTSRASALWCAEAVRILWHNRQRFIAVGEQAAAKAAYGRSLERYLVIASEANDAPALTVPRLELE